MIRVECSCEKKYHEIPTDTILVEKGAIEKTVEILKNYHEIYMVADENTYEVAGRRVEKLLKEAGILKCSLVLPAPAIANAETIGKILLGAGDSEKPYNINRYSTRPDYILAVGSGSVNDTCRMVAYRMGIPYGVVGTAPSMDGYASVVGPILNGPHKVVYDGTIARDIIIDLDINREAPYPLLLSGLGDMIGKFVALLDWEIARDLTGEYFCEEIHKSVANANDECIKAAAGLPDRDPDAIRRISEGLLLSGKCMAMCGSSRPASGAEHMMGQTFEVMDVEEGKLPNLHGIEVGEAVFAIIEMFRRLYEETDDTRVKPLIEKYLGHFDEIEKVQRVVRIPFTVTEKERFVSAVLRGRTFRERYTVLQYLYDLGKLEDYAEDAYEKVMKKYFYGTFKEQFPDWEG